MNRAFCSTWNYLPGLVMNRGLTVLSLKCILRTNAKQQNEVVSNFTEGSALRTSQQLPGRDTLVLFLLECLSFHVASESYRHSEMSDRGRYREMVAVLVGRGKTEHTESRWKPARGTKHIPCLRALHTLLFLEQSSYPRVIFISAFVYAGTHECSSTGTHARGQ